MDLQGEDLSRKLDSAASSVLYSRKSCSVHENMKNVPTMSNLSRNEKNGHISNMDRNLSYSGQKRWKHNNSHKIRSRSSVSWMRISSYFISVFFIFYLFNFIWHWFQTKDFEDLINLGCIRTITCEVNHYLSGFLHHHECTEEWNCIFPIGKHTSKKVIDSGYSIDQPVVQFL